MTYTDDELVAMSQQYTETRGSSLYHEQFIAHLAYAEINNQVRHGRPWAKCVDCGNPYPLDKPGTEVDLCSQACAERYAAYINNVIEEAHLWPDQS